jgi:hypothetical protein
MTIETRREQISVIFSESVPVIADIVIWLCLTFRKPVLGSVCLSTGKWEGQHFQLNGLHASPTNSTACWHGLLESAVVALEPSTQPSHNCWLDVEFAGLVQLAAVEYTTWVDSGLVLMGYSTALIPIRVTDDEKI